MFDSNGWTSEKEVAFDNLAPANGVPVPPVPWYMAGVALYVTLCRMHPLTAPFFPNEK